MPVAPSYRPDPRHLTLGDGLYDVVTPARFDQPVLRWRNDRAAREVGLDTFDDATWQAHMAHFEPLPHNLPEPLALRYHGHQFRHYNPDLGDGRGFLYAQLRDADDRLLDLGTKGSGRTPWSRGGDGRLTLKGGVRELMATELLEALGVPTSRTFSLFETGESLQRHDEPSPTRASVLVRLQWSHIRFGTFQRLAVLGDRERLGLLVAYVLDTYLQEADRELAPHVALLQAVVARAARLAAAWMNAGFVHGVLNTDNMNVTGESFDYGPWRFLPHFDVHFVAAYFDHDGLYSYARQPEAVLWNLQRLAEALMVLGDGQALHDTLEAFLPAFRTAWRQGLLARLGVASVDDPTDAARTSDVVRFLSTSRVQDEPIGFERFFFDWHGGAASAERAAASPASAHYAEPAFAPVRAWLAHTPPAPGVDLTHPYFAQPAPCTLLIDEVEALWAPIATHDDWAPLYAKVDAIRSMGEALTPPAARRA